MSKKLVMILKITSGQLTVTQTADQYGISRRQLHRLLNRYREGGEAALEPRSRRPHSNPHQTPPQVRERIITLRRELTNTGLDAGPVTIAWHLVNEGHRQPSTATIRRVLHAADLITPEPKKRPKSSYIRFQAAQPNETWQSDFTHWRLANGTDVEILNWLDDHSRYLLSTTVHTPVTGDDVVTTFLANTNKYGTPTSTLTDNGRVYTARHGGGHNAFEHLLPLLGVKQKNGRPGHPQTQGKIERFHQTLKRWLTAQPPAASPEHLQHQLDEFREYYNEQRPHRANANATPSQAYQTTQKATPITPRDGFYRIRYDRVDKDGKLTLRHAGRLHHLGIGKHHARTQILMLIDTKTVTVINLKTGQILSEHTINEQRNYWHNKQREPGRWPGSH